MFTPYPTAPARKLAEELLGTAETNAADALHRCHRALELDGHAHGYTADEWLPVIYDAPAPLLESSHLDQEPPSVVRQTQEAVRWLSSSIACLDEDSRETPAALADTLARLLVVCVFVDAATQLRLPRGIALKPTCLCDTSARPAWRRRGRPPSLWRISGADSVRDGHLLRFRRASSSCRSSSAAVRGACEKRSLQPAPG